MPFLGDGRKSGNLVLEEVSYFTDMINLIRNSEKNIKSYKCLKSFYYILLRKDHDGRRTGKFTTLKNSVWDHDTDCLPPAADVSTDARAELKTRRDPEHRCEGRKRGVTPSAVRARKVLPWEYDCAAPYLFLFNDFYGNFYIDIEKGDFNKCQCYRLSLGP